MNYPSQEQIMRQYQQQRDNHSRAQSEDAIINLHQFTHSVDEE